MYYIVAGCESGYFLINEMCMACPNNSENTDPSSNSCTCKGSSVTLSQESTTMMEDCSSIPTYTMLNIIVVCDLL